MKEVKERVLLNSFLNLIEKGRREKG